MKTAAVVLFAAAATLSLQAQTAAPATPAAVAAPAPAAEPASHMTAAVDAKAAELMEADRKFAADSLQHGGSIWGDWFAPDAMKPGPHGKWLIGAKAIGEQMTKDIADGAALTWYPTDAQISGGGRLGYTWGRFVAHRKGKSGKDIVNQGNYMTVWNKQNDGSWKIVFDDGDADPK